MPMFQQKQILQLIAELSVRAKNEDAGELIQNAFELLDTVYLPPAHTEEFSVDVIALECLMYAFNVLAIKVFGLRSIITFTSHENKPLNCVELLLENAQLILIVSMLSARD